MKKATALAAAVCIWPQAAIAGDAAAGDAGAAALRAAVAGRDLAIGAEHQHCDGLGLLALLGTALPTTPTSSARAR